MSFNTSYLSTDTITADIHYVEDLAISKNQAGNMVFDAPVIEAIIVQSSSVIAESGVFTYGLNPLVNGSGDIAITGNLDLNGGSGIKNITSLTIQNNQPVAGYVLSSSDTSGTLAWIPDATGSTPSLGSVLDVGNTASTNIDMGTYDITNASNITSTFVKTDVLDCANPQGSQINVSKNLNLSTNILYAGTVNTGEFVASSTVNFGVEPNRWSGATNHTLSQYDGYNNVISDSGADLLGFHDVQSIRGKFYTTDENEVEKFSANSSGDVYCNKVLSIYQLQNSYYVSPNGSDSTGTGAINNPYQSIQKAIDICSALTVSDNVYRYILVQAGSYSGNLNITTKINLIGMGESPFASGVGCAISGSITINIAQNGGDLFNNCVNISGFLIGSLVSFVSTENSILNIENCFIYSDDNTSGRAIYFNPSCVNSRLRITNSIISSGGSQGLDPLMEITKSSSLSMNNVILTSKGVQNVLMFSGTATCDTVSNCKLTSDIVSAVAPAIVRIRSTNSGTYTFSNCGFIYGNDTSKSQSPSSSGILCDGASGNPRIVILYCSFFLLGTSAQTNYAVNDLNYGTATAMACLYYMNNASLSNAFAIRAVQNTNKFQLQIVS